MADPTPRFGSFVWSLFQPSDDSLLAQNSILPGICGKTKFSVAWADEYPINQALLLKPFL
jgi:hypothetical protein